MSENTPIDACDAPLLELQIQIAGIWYDRKKFKERIEELEDVLKGLHFCGCGCSDDNIEAVKQVLKDEN